jgi:hypothetical protein
MNCWMGLEEGARMHAMHALAKLRFSCTQDPSAKDQRLATCSSTAFDADMNLCESLTSHPGASAVSRRGMRLSFLVETAD